MWDPRRRIDRFAVGLRVQRRVPVEVGNQAEASVLFELIAERYERKSIAITANAPFSAWDEVFPDKALTIAAVDRL